MVIDDIWMKDTEWKVGKIESLLFFSYTIHLRAHEDYFFSFGGGINFWSLIMKANVIMPELNSTEVFKGKISSDLGHQKLVFTIC